jgi:hypothetical protein
VFKLLATAVRGAFSLNPPYVWDYYSEMATLLVARLAEAEASGAVLAFTVVVGANEAVRAQPWYEELARSPYCKHLLFIKIHEHGFIQGHQHMKKDALEKPISVCDTGVFFLQSAAASARWPLTSTRLNRIEKAWLSTAPPK